VARQQHSSSSSSGSRCGWRSLTLLHVHSASIVALGSPELSTLLLLLLLLAHLAAGMRRCPTS
jgi:hypothetical protein